MNTQDKIKRITIASLLIVLGNCAIDGGGFQDDENLADGVENGNWTLSVSGSELEQQHRVVLTAFHERINEREGTETINESLSFPNGEIVIASTPLTETEDYFRVGVFVDGRNVCNYSDDVYSGELMPLWQDCNVIVDVDEDGPIELSEFNASRTFEISIVPRTAGTASNCYPKLTCSDDSPGPTRVVYDRYHCQRCEVTDGESVCEYSRLYCEDSSGSSSSSSSSNDKSEARRECEASCFDDCAHHESSYSLLNCQSGCAPKCNSR